MGEAVFKSKFRNFFEQIDVPSATKTFQRTYFAAKVILEVNFLRKKTCQKLVFVVNFGVFLSESCVFSARAHHSNLLHIGPTGA